MGRSCHASPCVTMSHRGRFGVAVWREASGQEVNAHEHLPLQGTEGLAIYSTCPRPDKHDMHVADHALFPGRNNNPFLRAQPHAMSRKSFTVSMTASHLGRDNATCVPRCVGVCFPPNSQLLSFARLCQKCFKKQTFKSGKQAKLCEEPVSTFQFPTFWDRPAQHVPTASSSSFVRWMSWIVKGAGNCNGDEKTAFPVSVGMPRPLASGCFRGGSAVFLLGV